MPPRLERVQLGRPKQALITREAAAKAALAAIDAEGLENFSLNSVAKSMGVKAQSLYYHYKDKAALLAEVARLVLAESPYDVLREGNWEENTVRL